MNAVAPFRRIPPYSAAVFGEMQERGIGGRRSYSAAAVFPIGGGMNKAPIEGHASVANVPGLFRRNVRAASTLKFARSPERFGRSVIAMHNTLGDRNGP